MRLTAALLCSALMMSGCSDAADLRSDLSQLLSPPTSQPKKASLTSPTPQKAPAKPAAGSGTPTKVATPPACPDVDHAAYSALEQPVPLPPTKKLLSPDDMKRWIDAHEGQIKDLKAHLRKSTSALSACHGKS